MKSFLVLTGAALLIQSCSTAQVRVMPGENGNHKVVARDIERDDAEEAAANSAKDFCKDHGGKMAVFTKDSTKYTGDMDESTRKTVRNASRAAQILGGVGTIPGESRTAGAVLGGAGTVGRQMTSDRDYEAVVEFKCQ